VHPLPAATATDFRRELLHKHYDIIHFAGHADGDNLVFEDEKGNASTVSLDALREAVARKQSVKVLILNGCETGKNLTSAIAPYTVAMSDAVDDGAAIEFARGFYDALVLEKTVPEAYQEGLTAVRFGGFDADHFQLLTS
jgi:CHAT domain-containing protein